MTLKIPDWVVDLPSFRQWVHSKDVPEKARLCFFHGDVWVDLTMEQIFSHNDAKTAYSSVLWPLGKKLKKGRYFSDGVLLSNLDADLASEPDGLFVSEGSFDAGKVRLIEGARAGYIEFEGTPDMTLEVVSDSSVTKDLEILFHLYWKAGISEYWVVDARGENLMFEIYRHSSQGYVAVAKKAGWVRSEVFGKSFRLSRSLDKRGHPEFTLQVR